MAFSKGKSGNPVGRPKGSGDRRTALRKLLEPHAEDLTKKAVELALGGDTTALRLCLERIVPALRTQETPVILGRLKGSLTEQAQRINQAMAQGKITPAEASSVLSSLASQAKIEEFDELETRISALEARQ